MAGGKETPRQKMIGMMYLVLTALLAMNISKDVLNAFIQINHGLNKTNSILEEKSQRTIDGINKSPEGAKAVPFQKAVADVDKWADELIDYIELMKAHVMASSTKANETGEGFDEFMIPNPDSPDRKIAIAPDAKNADGKLIISKPDENQNNTSLLIGHAPEAPRADPYSATDLKKHLIEFKERLMKINVQRADSGAVAFTLPEDLQAAIEGTFNFDGPYVDKDGKEESWEVNNFFHMPLVAVLASMTKIETDVMNIKNNVCMALAQGINATDMKFSDITVAVVPKSGAIIKGGDFEADVFLAAFNRSSKSKIYISSECDPKTVPTVFPVSGSPEAESDNTGKCHFKRNTGGMSIGEHAFKGQIEYMKNGKPEYIPFIIPAFYVMEPMAVISASNCNVLYAGLENPLEVSVPGVNGAITATGQGCQLSKNGSGYIAKPDAGAKEAIISVSANVNGQTKSMGSKRFRIKQVSSPQPIFADKSSSDVSISRSDLIGKASVINAVMDPNFLFEGIKFTVTGFTFTVNTGTIQIEKKTSGNRLTAEMLQLVQSVKVGATVAISNISATGPGGSRPLAPIVLKVN
jgi:gliding motility-associated protein GldM